MHNLAHRITVATTPPFQKPILKSLPLPPLPLYSPMEWTRGPTIGRGSSAAVSLATALPSGDLFAVKSAELSRSAFLQKEQILLSRLSCPRIVKCLGFDVTAENNHLMYNLFMEYVPGGTLFDAVQRHGGSLDENLIGLYTRQILQGLQYLHCRGFVHCDVKSQNVLIGRDGAKIADLGCARLTEDVAGKRSSFPGTPAFMAPEVARGEEQGCPADVWAVGCTVIEMATGRCPWPEVDDPVSALYRVGFSGNVPEIPGWLSENAKDFLSKCLQRNAGKRWTVKQLLEHPFVNELELQLDSHTKEGNVITRSSPTTVLDQGFWDSLEPSESLPDPTRIGSSSSSPADRIGRLSGGSMTAVAVPNREWDEDWVTVRINLVNENENFSDWMGRVEDLRRSVVEEDLPLKQCSYHRTDCSGCFSIKRGLEVASDKLEDVHALRCFSFQREMKEEFCFIQFKSF